MCIIKKSKSMKSSGTILPAAEQDSPEAMKKLADMYRTGDGVERDYEASAQWLEKLVEHWKKKYDESGKKEDGDKLFLYLWYAGDAWRDIGRLSRARKAYEEMLTVAQRLQAEFDGYSNLRMLSVCYERLGSICVSEGNLSKAKEWYEKKLEHDRLLIQEVGRKEDYRELSISYERVGDVYYSEGSSNGDFSKARDWYEKKVEIDERLVHEFGMNEDRRNLSIGYERLGDICLSEKNKEEAKKWYEQSLAIWKKLVEENGSSDAQRGLAISYTKLGDLYYTSCEYIEAQTWYRKSLKMFKNLVEEASMLKDRRNLVAAYERCGILASRHLPCKNEEDGIEADSWYENGLKILKEISSETDMPEDRCNLQRWYERKASGMEQMKYD